MLEGHQKLLIFFRIFINPGFPNMHFYHSRIFFFIGYSKSAPTCIFFISCCSSCQSKGSRI
jgi:hypothetical protein